VSEIVQARDEDKVTANEKTIRIAHRQKCKQCNGAVSKSLIKSNDETTSLRVVQFTPKLKPVYNFSINFDFLDLTLLRRCLPMYSFAVNIDFLDSTSMPICSFAVNFDFLDFTFSVSTKERGCIDPATF